MFIVSLYGCYAYLTAALLSSNASTPHVSVLICPEFYYVTTTYNIPLVFTIVTVFVLIRAPLKLEGTCY